MELWHLIAAWFVLWLLGFAGACRIVWADFNEEDSLAAVYVALIACVIGFLACSGITALAWWATA